MRTDASDARNTQTNASSQRYYCQQRLHICWQKHHCQVYATLNTAAELISQQINCTIQLVKTDRIQKPKRCDTSQVSYFWGPDRLREWKNGSELDDPNKKNTGFLSNHTLTKIKEPNATTLLRIQSYAYWWQCQHKFNHDEPQNTKWLSVGTELTQLLHFLYKYLPTLISLGRHNCGQSDWSTCYR